MRFHASSPSVSASPKRPPRRKASGAVAEEPALEGFQELFLVEALHPLLHAVLRRDLEIVLEGVVRRPERVAELVALEDVVVRARGRNGAVLGVDRPADSPESSLTALDPDHDLLAGTVLPNSVEDPFGKARAPVLGRHRPQDTIAPVSETEAQEPKKPGFFSRIFGGGGDSDQH